MNGIVFNIQRFCVDDGPGIRTTVFLKGCPLRCAWCHNPESHRRAPEILFDPQKCIFCASCQAVCPNHEVQENRHLFDRTACIQCGKCENICLTGALEMCGKEMTDEQIIQTVLRDKPFYQKDGGMTLSGGEPLMQFDFSLSLLRLAKENGIHTAIETCGFANADQISQIACFADLFLFDIKHCDAEQHKAFTGVDNTKILENLALLNSLSKEIILRCPIIDKVNLTDEHISYVLRLAEKYEGVRSIEFEPYHPLGVNKARLIDLTPAYDSTEFLDKNRLAALIDKHRHLTDKPISVH